MLKLNILCLSAMLLSIRQSDCLDTIFAKGGTCMYKISKQYDACMDTQKAQLIEGKENSMPVYTHAAMIDTVNKISCCSYWRFVSCVDEAAAEFCPGEKVDMRAYVRQLGSAVPVEECLEHYPRGSPHCKGYLLSSATAGFQHPLLLLSIIIFAGLLALSLPL